MNLFTAIQDGYIIIHSKGVWTQRALYRRGDDLYAKHGPGFIGLRKDGVTTAPSGRWEELEGVEYHFDDLGRMKFGQGGASKIKRAA